MASLNSVNDAVLKGIDAVISTIPRPPHDIWAPEDPQLSDEDRTVINDYAGSQFKRISRELPTSLYHYTDGSGLIGILREQRMHATHVAYLNDVSEIRHSIEKLQSELRQLYERASDPDEKEFFHLGVRLLDLPLNDHAELAQIWVVCFSSEQNQLSQWRAYGGYCIEFNARELLQAARQQGYALASCIYDSDDQTQLIRSAAGKMAEIYSRRKSGFEPTKRHIYGHKLFQEMMHHLSWLAPLLKHPTFREENEWRIYKRRPDGDSSGIEFTSRHSMITGHIAVDLRRQIGTGLLLPVTKILVGPGRNVSLSCVAISAMLNQIGYTNIEVIDCKVPFRAD
ncbi:MAG TPA: DUF2971 domain-containing protein [Micropepsaceae bacterium]|nr:DUF2971 domain-containing protein [Micropepsaceae bacterium]